MRPFNGYPDAWGAHKAAVFGHAGPSSYTQVTLAAATLATGGDTVQASEAGLKYLDKLDGGTTDDGIFIARPIPVTPSGSTSIASQMGVPGKTYILQWIANKTGTFGGQAQTAGSEAAAATDLSTFIVRLTGFGPN